MGFTWKKSIIDHEYLTKKQLINLANYKYNAVDNSPISNYILHPYWDTMVKLIPMWIAPNVLTFAGFLSLMLSFVVLSFYDYNFYGPCSDKSNCSKPNALLAERYQQFVDNAGFDYSKIHLYMCDCVPAYVWLLGAICQFVSHTLDGMDGKQARRTKSSSPLGELFDHGVDSWTQYLMPLAIFSFVGRGTYGSTAYDMYFIVWTFLFGSLITHWEKYMTGVLFIPWSLDIAHILVTLVYLLTYWYGQSIWLIDLNPVISMKFIDFLKIFIYVCAFGLSIPFVTKNVIAAYKTKTNKQTKMYDIMTPLVATFYLFIVQLAWITYSRVNIIELEPRTFFWLTGTFFSNICSNLIVAGMTGVRFKLFNWMFVPLTLIVLTIKFVDMNASYEPYLLYLITVLVTLGHIHYGICVIRQICRHLNIYCFVITSKPDLQHKKAK